MFEPIRTGDTNLGGGDSAALIVPDDAWIRWAIVGVLSALCQPENWQQVGTITPDVAAEIMRAVLESFTIDTYDLRDEYTDAQTPLVTGGHRTVTGSWFYTDATGLRGGAQT